MRERRDYLEMVNLCTAAFASGTFDAGVMERIMEVALRDRVVDDNERRVLGGIVHRLRPEELAGELGERIAHLRCAHGF
jgi:hypothetical protein